MKIGIIGKGNVGTAIGTGLSRKGHEVKFGHRDPKEPVADAAKWGEVIILAVPYEGVPEAAKAIGSAADGKVLLDVTNAIGDNMNLAIGFSTSAAEELQKKLPKARVAKAFNTVFAQNQSTGRVGTEQLSLFVASDDAKAKQTIMQLGRDVGFDPVDAGPLKSARYLEPMATLLINLGYGMGMGTKIGYKLVKG
jgi:predicted dinucleotide-binding enzyme